MQVITCIREELNRLETQSTTDRILDAAIYLISDKGYAAATTKSIAELAEVNEVTVFRHFGNKRGILKAIVSKFSYGPVLQKTLEVDTTWNLEKDLLHFAREYSRFMLSIKEFVLIGFKEAGAFPEIDEEIANVPLFIKTQLMSYFAEMKKQGKMIDLNEESVALSFIAINFGHFLSAARLGTNVTELDIQLQITTSVTIFSRGLTP